MIITIESSTGPAAWEATLVERIPSLNLTEPDIFTVQRYGEHITFFSVWTTIRHIEGDFELTYEYEDVQYTERIVDLWRYPEYYVMTWASGEQRALLKSVKILKAVALD